MYEQGQYHCEVTSQGFSESQSGTPFFFLKVEPDSYIEAGGEVRPVHDVAERTVYMYLTDKTNDRVIGQLRELGFDGSSFRELEPGGGYSFVGDTIILRCEHDVYENKRREKWDIPFSGGAEQTEGVARRLDRLFGADLKRTATNPVKQPTSPPSEPTNIGTGEAAADDVPF